MALDLKVPDLQAALSQGGARWIADVTNLSHLPEPEKLRRLGATHPQGAAGLQQREASAKQLHAAALAAPAAAVAYPRSWDWRDARGGDYITPITDQSSCGSCVAFGTIAALESMVRLALMDPNAPVDLSEAQLFYCDASQQNCNCETGWWPSNALQFLANPGVGNEADFPYVPGDRPCNVAPDWQSHAVRITGSQSITDRTAMKTWLSTRGPLISCFTVYDDFFSYRSGVYHHVSGAVAGGHCICVIGYDDVAQCWICKNSWGPGWGDSGFFRIAYGECGIDADMWGIDDVVLNKVTLGDTSRVTPALAVLGNKLVLAWTGTDSPSHLNVMSSADAYHFGGKITLNEVSFDGPAVAADGNRLFIAWTGTDAQHHLNVMSSTDGRTFGNKATLGDTALFGPALAFMGGHLYLAWVGTDGQHRLNVMSSTDGRNWGNKVTLNENSDGQVGLCVAKGTLYLVWQGTDSNSSINFLQSTDGRNWSNKITLRDSTDHTPAAVQGRELVLAWTGRDARHSLNRMHSTSGPQGFGDKITFGDTATAGVALAEFLGKVYIAWGGTDPQHHLNVMAVSD
jgi:C1A family cysteine protease